MGLRPYHHLSEVRSRPKPMPTIGLLEIAAEIPQNFKILSLIYNSLQPSQPTHLRELFTNQPLKPLYSIIILSHPFSTPGHFSSHVLQQSHIHHCTTSLYRGVDLSKILGGKNLGHKYWGGKNFLKIYFKKKIFKSSLQFSKKCTNLLPFLCIFLSFTLFLLSFM